jgi:hypothetical protein
MTGCVRLTVGDAKQSVKIGDLMIIPKGVLHDQVGFWPPESDPDNDAPRDASDVKFAN